MLRSLLNAPRHSRLLAAVTACLLTAGVAHAGDAPPKYDVAQTLKIGGDGGWDYVKLDEQNHRLYLPRQTHTQVVDANDSKVLADIPKNTGSHGVALVPSVGRGFISNGKGGTVTIFDLKTNEILGEVKTDLDSDGIIYDSVSDRVWVVCGDPGVCFAIKPDIDPKGGKVDPAIDLGGKPEFLCTDGAGKIYINLADKSQVAVVDAKTMKVTDHWSLAPGEEPTGLAIDTATHRLFSGCRGNSKLVVMDATNGKVVADLPIGAGVDAVAFANGFAFASCGDGTLTVAKETSPGKYEVVQTVKTGLGARTMAVSGDASKVYLPTADMQPPAAATDTKGRPGRPRPIAGTFKVLVVEPAK